VNQKFRFDDGFEFMAGCCSSKHRAAVLLAGLVFLLSGCDYGPTMAPVSGKIKIDGQPLTTGVIVVYQKGYRPATAQIQSDGHFKFKTLTDGDGCVIGEHPITVVSTKAISASSAKCLIPDRYGDIKQSDAKIKIDGANDELVIDLTWKGSGHTEPYLVRTVEGTE
jgi:hypothetical protein